MEQLNEFVHMGGYASYVWSAFGLSVVILMAGFYLPMQKEKSILQKIRKNLERMERSK
ncbi:MAG: heme exporter protein CcmD [Gammaproteobacteria bacterium]|nr:heme exporter protein CcmD [Gammaproteobacteria bacterium]